MDTTKIVEKIKYGNVELKLKTENLQEKTVDPSTEVQTVLPDHEYGGMSSVTINAVTSDIDPNIIPENIKDGVVILGIEGSLGELEGELLITENGIYDVRDYATANVKTEGKEDLDTELNEQDALLAELQSSVEELPEKPVNKVAQIVDRTVTEITESDLAGATEIGNHAFSDCRALTSITIPTSVSSIGTYAFRYCNSLLDGITIPDSVISIGEYAFYGCSNLTNVTIGEGVTSIGQQAFNNCNKLTAVHITNLNTWCGISFGASGGNPLFYAKNLYLNGELVTEVNFPEGIAEIKPHVFYNCTNLTKVTVPDGVTSIGSHAFYYCTSLNDINIPDSVTNIDSNAFYNCTSLTSITIPKSVTRIRSGAFGYCGALTDVVFEKGSYVTSLDGGVFNGCKTLTNLTLRNLTKSIQIGSGTSWGHLLTLDSLLNTIQELWINTSGTKTLTMGTANTAKLANVYVKLIDITDDMRAEDEYIDNKAPFVQCESTDEGAMLITEYVTTVKNWQLA